MKHFVKLIGPICLMVLTMMQTVNGQSVGEIHKAVAAGKLYKVQTLIEADSSLLELKDNNGNTMALFFLLLQLLFSFLV